MNWRPPSRLPQLSWYAASYASSQAARFGLSTEDGEQILREVEAKYLPAGAKARVRAQFREKLHLDELMLARGCARGHEAAWEEFWRRYQARLRSAARALTHESSLALELADGLMGDLFGLRTRDGERVSKLNSYMGIGSLEGWLCALLAQSHVDHWRRERRLVGLDESEHLRALLVPPNQISQLEQEDAPSALRPHLEAALESVLQGVDAPARLLLSLYFLDGQTLAQIGALLRVHESTVSRRLERVLGQLRRQTRRELGRRGVRPGATEEAMQLNPRWLRIDVRKSLHSIVASHPQAGPSQVSPHGF